MATYNKEAVDQAIKTSRQPISKKEARLIHALLKGRIDHSVDVNKMILQRAQGAGPTRKAQDK